MATRNVSTPQEDDFFDLHLRRMLDAPSFTENPRNVGVRMTANSTKSPGGMVSEASTRSSDGRGPAEAFAESGYFSSGTAPAYSRSPPPFSQPAYCSRDGGSVVASSIVTFPRGDAMQVGLPPTAPPMRSRGMAREYVDVSSSSLHGRPKVHDGFRKSRDPMHAQSRAGMSRDPMHAQSRDDGRWRLDGRHQRQSPPQALVGRTQTEDDERLLAESLCGFMQPAAAQGYGSSRPSSTPVAKAKPKKVAQKVPRCLQCGQAAGSSALDHVCPPCSAVVCAACVDDFRLITNSYRCPRCGDEQANQELLQDTAWRRSVFRSARSLYRNLSESWINLLNQNADGDASPPSACCSKNLATSGGEICDGPNDISRTPPPSRALEPQVPRCVTKLPESMYPPHSKLPESMHPGHRTRLPVGWEEAVAPRQARDL